MGLSQYSDAQLKEFAMIEIAYELLNANNNVPKDYHSLLKEVAEIKGMSEEEMNDRIAHLYTELTVDGRFVNLGNNQWGLKAWYPFDQTEEEMSQISKVRKKRKADDDDDDIDEDYLDEDEEFDEFEDLEDELDELANEEDDLFDDDDKDDIDDDDDFDVDLDEPQDDDDDLL